MDDSLLTLLEGMRYCDKNAPPKPHKRRRLNVEPGKSVGETSDEVPSTSTQNVASELPCHSRSRYVEDFEKGDVVAVYGTGDYVTFVYEGEVFPGQITDVQQEGFVIKSMVKSGFHWKRPKDEDILLYPFGDVKSKIAPHRS